MNIMNALTLRHMKLNKKRTVVTIIGVILSAAMLTAVPTFITSFLSMMQRSTIEDTGYWHVQYRGIPVRSLPVISEDQNTASVSLSKDIGYARLFGSLNREKPYLFIKAFDAKAFETYNVKLLEGRLPEKPGEVVISSHISENGGVTYRIGDTLSLDIGQRHLMGDGVEYILDQTSGYMSGANTSVAETFIAEGMKEYTITGIIERPGFEYYWAPGYTVIAYLDPQEIPDGTVNASVVWKTINKQANTHANELISTLRPAGGVAYNTELLRLYGITSDNILTMLYSIGAVVTGLIILGSVAFIYNAFAISISDRSRHLGMLASVGATKKQKRQSVLFEGIVVGAVGIPIGIFFGTLGMGITFRFVSPLLKGMLKGNAELTLVTSPETIAVAFLIAAITIFISAYIPSKRAARISPIEAIRQTQDIRLTGRRIKTSRLTRGLFGFEAELGLKNLKRNNRRYKATVFSLIISIVLFLSVSALAMLTRKSTDIVASEITYSLKVKVTSSATPEEMKAFYKAVSKLEYADESVIMQTIQPDLTDPGNLLSGELKALMDANAHGDYSISVELRSIDDLSLERYAQKVGADLNLLKDPQKPSGILVNTVTLQADDGQYVRMEQFSLNTGDEIKLTHLNSEDAQNSTRLEVAALAYETPLGERVRDNPFQAQIIVSEDVFDAIMANHPEEIDSTYYTDMVIKSSNSAALSEKIREYQQKAGISSLYVYDVEEERNQMDRFYTFMCVFLYGFVALIAAICAANIFNTISTSISLRKREFAMLKSVGMTPQGFNKMINYESLFYGIKALSYGLPAGFLVMYGLFCLLRENFDIRFSVPWSSVAICIFAVFILVGSTMLYAGAKMRKENIIDALKNENI